VGKTHNLATPATSALLHQNKKQGGVVWSFKWEKSYISLPADKINAVCGSIWAVAIILKNNSSQQHMEKNYYELVKIFKEWTNWTSSF